MKIILKRLHIILWSVLLACNPTEQKYKADICIYGGTASGAMEVFCCTSTL